jgi:polar amino acid transport system permease protein
MYFKMLQGLCTTFNLFFVVVIFSIPLGFIICVMLNLTKNFFLKFLIKSYINIIRGTPLLLQLFFLFYGVSYIPIIGKFFIIKSRFFSCFISFVFNYAAYFAEIFRGGFLAVDDGQTEAAKSLSLSPIRTVLKILMPQVLGVTLPSICNECVSLVKDTSLMFSLGIQELLSTTKNIVNTTSNTSAYLFSAAIYFLASFLVIQVFKILEKTKFKKF